MNATSTPLIEPWVDAATVAAHLGFKSDHIRKLARAGRLPGVQMGSGARAYWRFKLSEIDVAQAAEQYRTHGIPASIVSPFVYKEAS